jgi:hypothetical protein
MALNSRDVNGSFIRKRSIIRKKAIYPSGRISVG